MLNKLKTVKTKSKKRIGRGYASGRGGHTVGRGTKGQKSRAGYSKPRPDFEGGSMPLSKRLPKLKGFSRKPLIKIQRKVIGLDQLSKMDSNEITLKTLRDSGLINNKSRNVEVKVVANGKIDKKIKLKGLKVSASAKTAIEKAGGKVEE
ncbi:50S ribosomal protein L15 [Candidatus Dojkabacteria bacterium]|nr:50S ribosomal protein L15 [Candidatus Dojkabacteria bacterium]